MPFFIAARWGALLSIAGSLVGRVLVSLGIGYATYTGVDMSITWMKAQVVQQMSGLGANTIAVLGALQVGRIISIAASAILARLTLQGLTSGTIKRMTVK